MLPNALFFVIYDAFNVLSNLISKDTFNFPENLKFKDSRNKLFLNRFNKFCLFKELNLHL